ncbi:MAG: TonB-dependent receptor [Gammaproteobacteria bacterium]
MSQETRFPRIAIAVLAATSVTSGHAQTLPNEEVVVTARRVEENLQDVPIAVSAFNQNTLQMLNLQDLDQIALFTPSLSYTSAFGRQPGSDRATMRGITTILNGAGNASAIATFVDGVFIGGTTQQTELFNLERVEILRGPQSAQFGRGTYAGAINYVTRGPSESIEGDVRATVAEHEDYRVSGWVSGPIVNNIGFFIGAGYDEFGGDYTNKKIGETPSTLGSQLGDDIGGTQTTSVTGKLFWDPTENLSITAKLGYQETDDGHFSMYLQNRFEQPVNNDPSQDPATPVKINNCCERNFDAPRAREYYVGEARANGDAVQLNTDILGEAGIAGAQIERTMAALTIDWDIFDGYTVSSLTGWVSDDIMQGFDTSYGGYEAFPFPASFRGAFNQIDTDEQTDFSTELRIRSPGEKSVRWTAGLYYYKGETEEKADERAFVDPGTGMVMREIQTSAFGGLDTTEIVNTAVFGGIDWDINDSWTATAELRYAEDEIKARSVTYANSPTPGADRFTPAEKTFESTTPRVTLTYRANDNVNIYGNIAKGTKPGDINSSVPTLPNGDPDLSKRFVDEEEAWNYELGVKSRVLEGRGILNVAGYFMQVENQQLTQTITLPSGLSNSFLDNVGDTDIFGIEVEASVLLGDHTTTGLTYSYTKSEIQDYINQDQADLLGSDGSEADRLALGSVAGQTTPRVPEHLLSLFARYERPFRDNATWFVSGDYAFESSKYAQVHNLIETGDRNILGLQAGMTWNNWTLTLWGRNVTDDDTPIDVLRYIDRSRGRLPGCLTVNPGASCTNQSPSTSPRGFGVTLPRTRQIGATVSVGFGRD